jgi:hypothetical protein
MASAKDKVLNRLSSVYMVRDKTGTAGSTTLSGAEAAGQTALSITAGTNFADGDTIRVGSGNEMELKVIASGGGTTTITVGTPLVYDHASGDPVVEQTVYDLGDITDAGATVRWQGPGVDVAVATKRLVFQTIPGFVSCGIEFALPYVTANAYAVALGGDLADVLGSGTTAAPSQFASDGNEFNEANNVSFIAIGTLFDGTVIRAELWSANADYTGVETQFTLGQHAQVPCKFRAAGGILTTVASPYTVDTSIRGSKNEVWSSLTTVGVFADGGASSTVASAAITAADKVFDVVSGTGFAQGDWVKIGTGDLAEYHQIEGVATNTITLRTFTLRAHIIGTAVVEQTITSLNPNTDGVRFSVGGSVEDIQMATNRIAIGLRSGTAAPQFQVSVIDLTLENFARSLGIPASDIASNRLPFNDNIATTAVGGFYFAGTHSDGGTFYMTSWANSVDVSDVSTAWTGTGVATIPLTIKPSSGFIVAHS